MHARIVGISNVARLSEAGDALLTRSNGMPGMGLCYGMSGLGKSTAVAWLATKQHGVYVRAMAMSTPSSLLESITKELNIASRGSAAKTIEAIVAKLAETGRPLFIDEADYVVRKEPLIDTLRDLHDLAAVPVILIGMEKIVRTISLSAQLAGRISQWVQFQPATVEDAGLLAKQLCEVTVGPDLVARLHDRAKGSVRNICVGLGKIEQRAKSRGLTKIAAADWPKEEEFFLGAPVGKAA